MNNQLKLLLYILFVVGIFYFIQNKFELFDISFENSLPKKTEEKDEDDVATVEQAFIEIPMNGTFIKVNVEIADTDKERELGLSGRRYLGDYEGMLFIFETEGVYPFWMSGMLIGLDMIFIDSGGYVVDIKQDLAPCEMGSCPSIYSKEKFMYNLEVNSGFISKHSIDIGDNINIIRN